MRTNRINIKGLILFGMLSLIISNLANGQGYKFGLSLGGNFQQSDNISELSGNGGVFKPETEIGYHAGIFLEKRFINHFFLRAEIFYNTQKVNYQLPSSSPSYSVEKFSLPFLFGYGFFKDRVDLFLGPAYQEILDVNMIGALDPIEDNVPNWALQIGVKFPIVRSLDVGIRYDYTFDSAESQFPEIPPDGRYGFGEGRLNQFLISLHFSLFDNARPLKRQRSGRGCYF